MVDLFKNGKIEGENRRLEGALMDAYEARCKAHNQELSGQEVEFLLKKWREKIENTHYLSVKLTEEKITEEKLRKFLEKMEQGKQSLTGVDLKPTDIDFLKQLFWEELRKKGIQTELNFSYAAILASRIDALEQNVPVYEHPDCNQGKAQFTLAENRHFGCQQLIDAGLGTELVPFNPYQLVYPRKTEDQQKYLLYFPSYIQNLTELSKEFAPTAGEILAKIHAGENVLIITNHLTFANIPIIIALLNCCAEPDDHILNQIYTVLGPALCVTKKEWDFITTISYALLTQPNTGRGVIQGFEKEQQEQREAFNKMFTEILKGESQKPGEKGKIVILAPSGTRDLISEEGKVVLQESDKMRKHLKIMANRQFKGAPVTLIPIGVNDQEVYAGREPQKGKVYLRVGEAVDLKNSDANGQFDAEAFVKQLANLVVDEQGNSIGVLDTDVEAYTLSERLDLPKIHEILAQLSPRNH